MYKWNFKFTGPIPVTRIIIFEQGNAVVSTKELHVCYKFPSKPWEALDLYTKLPVHVLCYKAPYCSGKCNEDILLKNMQTTGYGNVSAINGQYKCK